MLYYTIWAAANPAGVVDGGEAAVEATVKEFASLGGFEVVNQVGFAFVANDVDEGVIQFGVGLGHLKSGRFDLGHVDGEEAPVGVLPLLDTGSQF